MSTNITAADVRKHVNGLQAIGDQMEAAGDPRWLPIAQAAALLESLRLGLSVVTTEPAPDQRRWIGIDLAKPGTDRTAMNRKRRVA